MWLHILMEIEVREPRMAGDARSPMAQDENPHQVCAI